MRRLGGGGGGKVTWGLGYGEMPQEPFLGLHEQLTVGGTCKGQQAFESSPGTSLHHSSLLSWVTWGQVP